MSKKALDMGLVTKKQFDNLPPALLEAISKKKLKDNDSGTHKMADGSVMTGKKHNSKSKPVKKKPIKKKKK